MSSPSQHFDKILEELTLQCLFGQVHYRLWRQMNDTFREKPELAKPAIFFFRRTAEAHLDSATLHLNRLIDKDKKAVSITDLLNYAEQHPGIFPHTTEEHVFEVVEADRRRLEELEPTTEKIRQQRNKHFVHRAKEYFHHPRNQVYKDYPTKYVDIYDILQASGEILNHYRSFRHNSEQSMNVIGEDDFDHLIFYLELGLKSSEEKRRARLRGITSA